MTNTVKFVRVTKIEDNEKDYLTVGKLYAVQRIDEEGDFHIIDDENDMYYVDKWNSELVEGKEIVKCTDLLTGDRDKFVVGDLYEVISTDEDGDVRVKDKNGDRTLLVTRQFERVYAPAETASYVRVTKLIGYDFEKLNFTVGKVYKVIRRTQNDNYIVKDDNGAESVLVKRQIELAAGPSTTVNASTITFNGQHLDSIIITATPKLKTKVKVTALRGIDFIMIEVGKVYDVIEKEGKDYIIALDNNRRYRVNGNQVVEVNY